MSEKKFCIDFFEFSFLVESCIPPVPIARGMFWDSVINSYYYQMTLEERNRLYVWLMRNPRMEKPNNESEWFIHRFNPDNQYIVHILHDGKKSDIPCFKVGDRYHTQINTSISPEYIVSVEKDESYNNLKQ